MISAETFVSSWQAALDRSSKDRVDLDLVDILRTEKKLVGDILREMLQRYRAQLRRIAAEPKLSLRVLSILLRGGAVQAEELRNRPGFLANVCSRMSLMNAIRLTRAGLLRHADIDDETRSRLIYDRKSTKRHLQSAIESGLIDLEDLPAGLRERMKIDTTSPRKKVPAKSGRARFSAAMLSDARSRMKVDTELAKKRWTVVLKRLYPDRDFGFVGHADFAQDIFCRLSIVATANGSRLREGQKISVIIATNFDKKRQRWGFAVESGHIVD